MKTFLLTIAKALGLLVVVFVLVFYVWPRPPDTTDPRIFEGDVDVPAILRALAAVDYAGLLSIEYFDLPDRGWPLEDPVAAALDFAQQVRSAAG